MTIDKALTVDLNRVQPHKVIKIHEGDVNSVFLVLTVTKDGDTVSLSGLTIKYDATIAGYLAEQDASGSVSANTIRIPITKNMTALPGTLKIDVKMKSGSEVLYTQTVKMIVEKSVIDDSTIIDFEGTTIGSRMNELEAEMLDVKTVVQTLNAKFPIKADAIKDGEVMKVESISAANVDSALKNNVAYSVLLDGRSNLLFCVNSGTNLRAQVRFDTLGYMKYRSQTKHEDVWNDWTDWTPIASNINMANGAVTTIKIADKAVTHDKLANGAVAAVNIQSGCITADELASGAVTEAKIASGSVSSGKIAANAVTGSKLANDSVTGSKLSPGAVTTDKIEIGAVTQTELADSAVTTAKIADGSISSQKLMNSVISTAKIVDRAVGTSKIADGSITTVKLDDGAVTTDKIAYDAVTTSEIADGAITVSKIASGVIPTKVSDLTNDSHFVSDLSDYMKRITTIVPSEGGQLYFDRYGISLSNVNLYANLYNGAGSKRIAWYDDLPDISTLMGLTPNVNTSAEIEALTAGQLFISQGNVALKTSNSYIILAPISRIPTRISDLTNDSGFITAHQDISDLMHYAPRVNTGEEILALQTGQIFFYQSEVCLKGDEDYTHLAKLSQIPNRTSELLNDSGFLTAHQDISGKADIENGTIASNHAWYTNDGDGYVMTGDYTIIGNMCFMRATAYLINGWERVYYSLPVAAKASASTIAVHGNGTFSVATGTLSNISVLEIKQIGSSSMPSGTISFTLIYKCK